MVGDIETKEEIYNPDNHGWNLNKTCHLLYFECLVNLTTNRISFVNFCSL